MAPFPRCPRAFLDGSSFLVLPCSTYIGQKRVGAQSWHHWRFLPVPRSGAKTSKPPPTNESAMANDLPLRAAPKGTNLRATQAQQAPQTHWHVHAKHLRAVDLEDVREDEPWRSVYAARAARVLRGRTVAAEVDKPGTREVGVAAVVPKPQATLRTPALSPKAPCGTRLALNTLCGRLRASFRQSRQVLRRPACRHPWCVEYGRLADVLRRQSKP